MIRTLAVIIFTLVASTAHAADLRKTVFAGGCFWCVESDFDRVQGVVGTVSGFIGGTLANPSYKQVTAGGTGHYEAVEITYDAEIVSYEQLLYVFWRSVDATDAGGQFCDRGQSYKTGIFVATAAERQIAEASRKALAGRLPGPIVTEVIDAGTFWPAEDYHQGYYQKNPLRYNFYRSRCGRDNRVQALWGDEAWTH